MTTDLSMFKVELERIERELDALKDKIHRLEEQDNTGEMPFTKMRGVWKGAGFSEEEIDAAKIRVKDFPE